MSRDRSADPFSTFLNATSRHVTLGHASDGSRSTDPLPPAATETLRVLHRTGRSAVGELRTALELTTLQIAEVVSMLHRLGLVEVHSAGSDDVVELTPDGRRLIEQTG